MSFYWDFKLDIKPASAPREQIEAFLVAHIDWPGEAAMADLVDGGWAHLSWGPREHEKIFRALSRKFPEALFTLDVVAEDETNETLYRKYFKNGRMQLTQARISYDRFDPRRLE